MQAKNFKRDFFILKYQVLAFDIGVSSNWVQYKFEVFLTFLNPHIKQNKIYIQAILTDKFSILYTCFQQLVQERINSTIARRTVDNY
jgi:hypothetical protein